MLTPDMKRLIAEHSLGFVATVDADGMPNVSPKGTFFVVDDRTLAFGEIRSPGTVRNLRVNPRVEVNFIDPFARKGYRFRGSASIVARSDDGFDALLRQFAGTLGARFRAIVVIAVTGAAALSSPAYDDGTTEPELRRAWTTRFRKLQPNERFEE